MRGKPQMKCILLLATILATFAPPLFAADPLEVRLTVSPAATLPSLPVAMRVSIKNVSGSPIVVVSPMTATVTSASGAAWASVSLPTCWLPEIGNRGRFTIATGATLECIAPIDGFFAQNGLFLAEELPLWKPGAYEVTVDVHTEDGARVASNAVPLTVTVPNGDDAAIWQELSHEGQVPFTSLALVESFTVLARYPTSEYYRHVSPFILNMADRDEDRYATNLMLGVQGLPGAYVDGARLSIAIRYLQRATGESAANNQVAAGQSSAKGRVYTQQLTDSPASPFGAITAQAVQHSLRTVEQWPISKSGAPRP